MQLNKEFSVLKQCLLTAGKIAHRHLGKVDYDLKARANLVTKADVACQKSILQFIKKFFPSHDFLAEENGLKNTGSDWKWIIDPIDGTTNFAHTMPHFSVSIALAYKNEIVLGGLEKGPGIAPFGAEAQAWSLGPESRNRSKRAQHYGEKALHLSLNTIVS